jgi:2-oxoglutarate dehydrogenase E2 component (dihydrolipoamide succinyltransferase)
MKKNVVVPELGESVAKGIIVEWLKKTGDAVAEGDPLFELETDKATVVVPSTFAGIVRVLVEKEAEVSIGQAVAEIDVSETPASPGPAPAAAKAAPAPAVQKTPPTAPAFAETPQTAAPKPVLPQKSQTVPAPGERRPQTRVKMSLLRKRTAERLVLARRQAVHVTTFNEIDMGKVMEIRSHYQDAFEKEHRIKIGFMSFFVKACCKALASHRELNAVVEGDEIVYNDAYNIGVAISTERGLVVPVVHHADALTFADIETAIAELAKRARDRLLTPTDLLGGTFSITNGGVFGSLMSTPVPAYPQSAILGMHAIKKRPVVVNDEVAVRPMMYVALTYDHRIVDGRDAVGFLVKVKEFVEDPDALLLEL